MLTVNHLAKHYADQLILSGVTFTLNAGDRVGLIGPNGSGKTTLLRLIVRQDAPDQGSVFIDPATRLGYLQQGLAYAPKATLADALIDPRVEAAAEVERLAEALARDPDRMPTYQAAVDRLEALGGYPDPGVRASVLSNLGLDGLAPDTPVAALSGGQKTRLGLARVLLTEPNLLLLDEPTNHLDLPLLTWLEDWLRGFPGATLIVSHDRVFLDRSVNRILYLDPQTHTLREYAGNYTNYLEQSLAEHAHQLDRYRLQAAEIRRMKQDIARTFEQSRSVERATTPRQPNVRRIAKKVANKAKSREKKLDRYLASDERIEKPRLSWQMQVDFNGAPVSGQDVLRLEHLSVGYGERVLLRDLSLTIRQGERVALVGANGSGKSTWLKTIVGQVPALAGEARLGAGVRVGYFAQEQDVLDPDATPLDSLRAVAPMNDTDARSFLHYFLFTGDQSLISNRLLSYGERARLMLALLVAQGCNFLLLDEPINHLDIPSRTQFEKALTHFKGTALAVVHDRYFIRGFATKVLMIADSGIRIAD
ncbi:MAG TPA: ABC-F family ATP-binding cassette domain-containing protein [Anaerolineae bacterium]|nr:ABC-F family ATP-binding cassette domain-containing protein [Anaerolineae bacterium]